MTKPPYYVSEAFLRKAKHPGYTEREMDAMQSRWRVYGVAVAVLVSVALAVALVVLP